MSLSKVMRNVQVGPAISIGEAEFDFAREETAAKKMEQLLPIVAVMTELDGTKSIPVQEVFKIEQIMSEAVRVERLKGYEEGHQAGLQKGLDEARKVLKDLNTAIADAVDQRQILLEDARDKILSMVIQVSKKVTFDAVAIDPETTLTMINRVIDTLVDRSHLKIKVNPSHLPIVEQHIEKFLIGSTTIKELTVEGDPRVKYGGCFIETPTGDIDARLESQIDVIADEILSGESDA